MTTPEMSGPDSLRQLAHCDALSGEVLSRIQTQYCEVAEALRTLITAAVISRNQALELIHARWQLTPAGAAHILDQGAEPENSES